MSERIDIELDEQGIATVWLNRPEKRNAIDWAMLRGWIDAQKQLKAQKDLKGVILTGRGESFCAGLDFASFGKTPARIAQAFLQPGSRDANLFQQACIGWRSLAVPVAAAVQGHCFGGGIQLALGADFRFARPDAEFSVMEIKWGLIPDMSGMMTLRELIPIDLAKRLVMTAEVFSGEQAKQWNVVTELSDEPIAAARELLLKIGERSPDAVAAAKGLLQDSWHASDDEVLALERRWQRKLLVGKNQRIAVARNLKGGDKPYLPRRIQRV
ncbi:MAG: crotonase/enoyl-CoA hydratase family protein [Oceanococcus sp.]